MFRKAARALRTPAAIVAVLTLTVGVAGIAQAGPGVLSKAKVKKISAKQAGKVVDQKAGGLSVSHAKTADSATTADSAGEAADAAALGGIAAAQYLQGRELITEETAFTSNDKSLSVPCPQGKVVIGGGAQINTQDTNIALQGSRPSLNGQTWQANAVEVNDTAVNWSLQAYVICAG